MTLRLRVWNFGIPSAPRNMTQRTDSAFSGLDRFTQNNGSKTTVTQAALRAAFADAADHLINEQIYQQGIAPPPRIFLCTNSSDLPSVMQNDHGFDDMMEFVVGLGFRALAVPLPYRSRFTYGVDWPDQGWCPAPHHCIARNSTWSFATMDSSGTAGAQEFTVFQQDAQTAVLNSTFKRAFRSVYGTLFAHMRSRDWLQELELYALIADEPAICLPELVANKDCIPDAFTHAAVRVLAKLFKDLDPSVRVYQTSTPPLPDLLPVIDRFSQGSGALRPSFNSSTARSFVAAPLVFELGARPIWPQFGRAWCVELVLGK